eukprot:SAG22_NODE_991_length_6129_cov_8.370813_4_plen_125_part_00
MVPLDAGKLIIRGHGPDGVECVYHGEFDVTGTPGGEGRLIRAGDGAVVVRTVASAKAAATQPRLLPAILSCLRQFHCWSSGTAWKGAVLDGKTVEAQQKGSALVLTAAFSLRFDCSVLFCSVLC